MCVGPRLSSSQGCQQGMLSFSQSSPAGTQSPGSCLRTASSRISEQGLSSPHECWDIPATKPHPYTLPSVFPCFKKTLCTGTQCPPWETCSQTIFAVLFCCSVSWGFFSFSPAEITWRQKSHQSFSLHFPLAAARARWRWWKIALVPWTVNDAVFMIHQIRLRQRWRVRKARQSLEHNRAQEVRDLSFVAVVHLWSDC